MTTNRYFIRFEGLGNKKYLITHFLIFDGIQPHPIKEECVLLKDPWEWLFEEVADDSITQKVTPFEYVLRHKQHYAELTEDQFYKARITLKYKPK